MLKETISPAQMRRAQSDANVSGAHTVRDRSLTDPDLNEIARRRPSLESVELARLDSASTASTAMWSSPDSLCFSPRVVKKLTPIDEETRSSSSSPERRNSSSPTRYKPTDYDGLIPARTPSDVDLESDSESELAIFKIYVGVGIFLNISKIALMLNSSTPISKTLATDFTIQVLTNFNLCLPENIRRISNSYEEKDLKALVILLSRLLLQYGFQKVAAEIFAQFLTDKNRTISNGLVLSIFFALLIQITELNTAMFNKALPANRQLLWGKELFDQKRYFQYPPHLKRSQDFSLDSPPPSPRNSPGFR